MIKVYTTQELLAISKNNSFVTMQNVAEAFNACRSKPVLYTGTSKTVLETCYDATYNYLSAGWHNMTKSSLQIIDIFASPPNELESYIQYEIIFSMPLPRLLESLIMLNPHHPDVLAARIAAHNIVLELLNYFLM